jgi:hypothetical protein
MMASRATYLSDFDVDLLVECPRCSRCAHLTRVKQAAEEGYRLSCSHCAHARDGLARPGRSHPVPSSGPEEPSFGVRLWLRTPCCGDELWAYNAAHLSFLEAYVGAKLRGRRRDPEWGWSNQSLESRLPGWMTAASNRPAVLDAIRKLRARLMEA